MFEFLIDRVFLELRRTAAWSEKKQIRANFVQVPTFTFENTKKWIFFRQTDATLTEITNCVLV